MSKARAAAPTASAALTSSGYVVAAFGRHYQIAPEIPSAVTSPTASVAPTIDWGAEPVKCYPRGKRSIFACGDHVDFELSGPGQGVITRLHPRNSLLYRSDAFREKLIASNLTHVVVVVATEPGFSDLLISRCIAAAENQHIETLIVLNKADLSERLAAARERLALFARLGYRVIECSAKSQVAALSEVLGEARSILVGQSGMGKSTLTNALVPGADAATREISTALDSGKHTTTHARLYGLGERGWLIDSPGLQAFGLAHLDPHELPGFFVEFRPHLGRCRFRDCRHEAEPGCALTAAIAAGDIDPLRMEHFRQIRADIESARKQAQGW